MGVVFALMLGVLLTAVFVLAGLAVAGIARRLAHRREAETQTPKDS